MTNKEAIECLKYQNDKFFGGQSESLNMAINILNQQEWIPTSERLPKAFETVIRTRVVNDWGYHTYKVVDVGCICPIDHDIIAWMPLPQPYEGEGE